MKVDYMRKLIHGYLLMENKNRNNVVFEKLNGALYIKLYTDPQSDKTYDIMDTLQYIINLLHQINAPACHIQNVYRSDSQYWLELVYLEFSMDEYNEINQKLESELYPS